MPAQHPWVRGGRGRWKQGRGGEGEGRGRDEAEEYKIAVTSAIVLADGPVQITHFQCIANLQSVVVQNQELEVALARHTSQAQ